MRRSNRSEVWWRVRGARAAGAWLVAELAGCVLPPAAADCYTALTCEECLGRSGCGFCGDECLPGSSYGPTVACTEPWSWNECPARSACQASQCGVCLRDPRCQWCGDHCASRNDTCVDKDPVRDMTLCADAECRVSTTCGACTSARCTWCPTAAACLYSRALCNGPVVQSALFCR